MNRLSDREFQAWLDALERDKKLPASLPAEDAADLALARRLLAMRVAPSPGLAARVKGLVSTPFPRRAPAKGPGRRLEVVGAGIIASLVLAFTLAFTPAGSWAQGMLRYFGITFLPGAMPQWAAGLPEITPTRSPVAFSRETEVQAAAEFPLRWPTDFPFDRETVSFLGFMTYTQEGAWIESLYGDAERRYLEVQVFWQQRPGPWPVGDARFQSVSVAGHEGLWGEGVPASFIAGARSTLIHRELDGTVTRVGSSEDASLDPINVLLWEEDEVLYLLIDPNRQFSRAAMLQAAESAYQDH